MLSKFSIAVNKHLYVKNPLESKLGKRIVGESVYLIHQLGFEHFTFLKLARHLKSSEASVYRYFENKHKLLLFLANWYWAWMHYRIVHQTHLETDAQARLEKILSLLSRPVLEDDDFEFIDESVLHAIIVSEGPKVYLTKEVDYENKDGVYLAYKGVTELVAQAIKAINPDFDHPHTLASTIIEASHQQLFFSEHLPRLTDIRNQSEIQLNQFLTTITLNSIQLK